MRLPIQYAFSYPERWDGAAAAAGPGGAAARSSSSGPTASDSPACGLAYRALRGGRSLAGRCSTRPTRWRSPRSWTGASAFTAIPPRHRADAGRARGRPRPTTLDGDPGRRRVGARLFPETSPGGLELKSCRRFQCLTSLQTVLAFAFVLGVLIFVHELGHFLMARRIGVRVLTFSLGFGPRLLERPARRHGVLHQRDPARRLREDGRREPGRPAHGARPTSSCRRRKWQRFQVLIMGPVMNIVLAIVLMAVVLYARRGGSGVRVTRRRWSASSPRGRRRRAPACGRRSDRQRGRPRHRHLGAVLRLRRRAARARDPDRAAARWPGVHRVTVTPKPADALRDGRHRRAARRAPARPVGRRRAGRPSRPASSRATSCWRSRAPPITFARQLSEAIAEAAEHADHARASSGTARGRRSSVTPARRGDDRVTRHRDRRRDDERQAGPDRSGRPERAAERTVRRADLPDDLGAASRGRRRRASSWGRWPSRSCRASRRRLGWIALFSA